MSGNNRGAVALRSGYAFNRAFPLLARKQSEKSFELRTFRKSDEVSLASVINENWGLKSSAKNADLAIRFGYACLYYSLADSSFRAVAEYNGCAAGIVCAGHRKEGLPNIAYLFKAFSYALPLFFCSEFREQLSAWKKFRKLSRAQEKKLPGEYKGRLCLLITNSNLRGMGMGKKLLSSAEDYFLLNGMENFFLHTDENLSFYEAHGYRTLEDTLVIRSKERGGSWKISLLVNK